MWKKLQRNLITGFIFLLPAIGTIYVLQLLFTLIDSFLGQFITDVLKGLRIITVHEGSIYFLGVYTPFSDRLLGIGFILTIIIIAAIGAMSQKEEGRKKLDRVEQFFRRIPVANVVYTSIDQVINAFTQEKASFKKVVLIEYPRKGIYTLGFLTAETQGEVQRHTKKDVINVFLPTTPNPTSGWLILVPREDVIILDMSVEQGLKFIISGGVVVPPDKLGAKDQYKKTDVKFNSSLNEININVRKKAEGNDEYDRN
ncbi:DUF502 domain-containing protein [Anaerobacillus sp. MEB173]|uniref:DUF502 domain-containing protein n=1 Tax=Anaerobacillus sp. MEB173 TaxID=3383345 RepID=UPI003F8E4808